jgi:hypothetical protein
MNLPFITQLAKLMGPLKDCCGMDMDEYNNIYECHECRKGFRLMSALVQHAEFQDCQEVLDHGPLKKFCRLVAVKAMKH